jgi:predicted nucleic acid-binding protein
VKYLLDTNVVSEVMKPNADSSVLDWLEQHQTDSFISVFTVAEIERGIEQLPPGRKADFLRHAFADFLPIFTERVIGFDLRVARRWAKFAVELRRRGRQTPILDSMIEATALQWGLTVITRNGRDFVQAATLNPWSSRD